MPEIESEIVNFINEQILICSSLDAMYFTLFFNCDLPFECSIHYPTIPV